MKFTASHLIYMIVIACLCAMGIAYLYSTGYLGEEFAVRENYLRQCFYIGAGALTAVCICRVKPGGTIWRVVVFGGYGVSILLLLLVLVIGKSIGGARRWLDFGPMLLQPAEFARAFTVFAAAYILNGRSVPKRWEFPAGLMVFLLPMGLIILEPSYGNAMSLALPMVVMFGMRYLSKWLWGMALCIGVILIIGASIGIQHLRLADAEGRGNAILAENTDGTQSSGFFRGYHLKRLRSFLSAEGGWNEQQSVMAVAGGGLIGKGYLNGTMKNLGFLPRTVAPTDFIFAVVAEEGGFLFGVLPLLVLYWILMMLLMHWACRAQDRLCLNLIAGGTILLFTHIIVGVGMAIRLLPIIGLPLPLLSYGGSFTIAVFIILGAMAAADCHRKDEKGDGGAAAEHSIFIALGRLLHIKIKRAPEA